MPSPGNTAIVFVFAVVSEPDAPTKAGEETTRCAEASSGNECTFCTLEFASFADLPSTSARAVDLSESEWKRLELAGRGNDCLEAVEEIPKRSAMVMEGSLAAKCFPASSRVHGTQLKSTPNPKPMSRDKIVEAFPPQ
jgi:hypothetical protein